MAKKIKLIIGLGVILFIITALGLSKVEAAEVTEKQTKQLSKGKVEVITETKKVNGENVEVLKDVNLDFSAKTKGDVNGDGIVSVEDASYLLMKAVADTLKDETKLSSDESNYADIDGDGMITVKDAQYVLIYYAKKAAGLNPTWEQVVSYEKNDSDQIRKTGIEGYYKNGDKQYTIYAQGYNDLWGPKPYSQATYALSASGITNIATLLSGFGVNKNPEDVDADGIIKIDNLYHQLKNYFSKYGVSCTDWDYSKENIIDHLKSGNPVFAYIISDSDGEEKKIGNAYYSGHYVSLLGISSDGKIFLADPAGGGRNTGYFDQDDIIPGITSCVYISKDSVSVNESNSKVTDGSKKYDGTLDFDVNIDHQNSLPKLNENQLKQIVNNSDATQEAKNNMLSVIPDLVKYQDQYKVNAVFIMAFLKEESDWGTVEELVNSNTYNWGFIYGNLNGGYIDKHGNSWNKYNSFSEATEDLIKIISDSNGNYFGKQKYTIHELGDAICGGGTWNDHVSAKVQYFYDIINIDVK